MNRRLTAGLLIATMLATQTPAFATNTNETMENGSSNSTNEIMENKSSDSIESEKENLNSEEVNSVTPTIEEIVDQALNNENTETIKPESKESESKEPESKESESKLAEQSLNESPIVGQTLDTKADNTPSDLSGNEIAYEVTGGYIYFDKSTGKIVNSDYNVTEVTIPDRIEDVQVTGISKDAFLGRENLKKVELPSGLKSIEAQAFQGCISLETIELPDTLGTLGNQVFQYCEKLKSINLPSNLTSIGHSVFYNCTSLEEIIIPEYILGIFARNFVNCTNLKNVILPDNLKLIGAGSFNNCPNLENIHLPDTIETIDLSAFSSCTALDNIKLPNNLKLIGDYAFFNCSKLKTIIIPKNDAIDNINIASTAFLDCNLEEVYYAGNKEDWDKLLTNASFLEKATKNATIYYNSTGPNDNEVEETKGVGKYFVSCWGDLTYGGLTGSDSFHYFITSDTQVIGITKLDNVINRFTLIETDGYNIKRIQLINETDIGVYNGKENFDNATITEETKIKIDNNKAYPVAKNLDTNYLYKLQQGQEILYHVIDGVIVDFRELNKKTDTVTATKDGVVTTANSYSPYVFNYQLTGIEDIESLLNSEITFYVVDDMIVKIKGIGEETIGEETKGIAKYVTSCIGDLTNSTIGVKEDYLAYTFLTITENTQLVGINNLEDIVNKFVLLEIDDSKKVKRIQSIDTTAIGTFNGMENFYNNTITDTTRIKINGNDYPIAKNLDTNYLSKLQSGEDILYHIINDVIVDFKELNKITDTITDTKDGFFNTANGKSYTLNRELTGVGVQDIDSLLHKEITFYAVDGMIIKIIQEGKCGESVYWKIDDDTLTIWGEGKMFDYEKEESNVNTPWFEQKFNIKKVIIKDGVTSIGKYAFSDCNEIKTITVGKDVASVATQAFAILRYTGGVQITFAGNAPTISNDAFPRPLVTQNFITHYPIDIYYSLSTSGWNTVVNDNYINKALSWIYASPIDARNKLSIEERWAFNNWDVNRGGYFYSDRNYFMLKEDSKKLLKGLDVLHKERVWQHSNDKWEGSCYGMCSIMTLVKTNKLSLNDIELTGNSISEVVNETTKPLPEKLQSVINFYHLQQFMTEAEDEKVKFMRYPQPSQLNKLEMKIFNAGIALIGFKYISEGKKSLHAVIGYAKETGTFKRTLNNRDYEFDHRILIYDPNDKGANQNYPENALYYRSDGSCWAIPKYCDASSSCISENRKIDKKSTNNTAQLLMVTNDEECLNIVNYANNTRNASTPYTDRIDTANLNFTINKSSGGTINIEDGYFNGYTTIDDDNDAYIIDTSDSNDYSYNTPYTIILPETKSNYTITSDEESIKFKLLNTDYYLQAESDQSGTVNFKADGKVDISTPESGKTKITITSNDSPLPWYTIEVENEGVKELSAEWTEEGVVIAGDELKDVKVTGRNVDEDEEKALDFTFDVTDEKNSVLIKANDTDTELVVMIDTNNDGTYDTPIDEVKDTPTKPDDTDKPNDKPTNPDDTDKPDDKPTNSDDTDKPDDKPTNPDDTDKPDDKPTNSDDTDKPDNKPINPDNTDKPDDKPTNPDDTDKPDDKPNDTPTNPDDTNKPDDTPTNPDNTDKPDDKPNNPDNTNKPDDKPNNPDDTDKPDNKPNNPDNIDKPDDKPNNPDDTNKPDDKPNIPTKPETSTNNKGRTILSSSYPRHNVTVSASRGGTVKVNTTRATKGTPVQLTVVPETDYTLDKLIVKDKDGHTIDITKKNANLYTFVMPEGQVDIDATFKEKEATKQTPNKVDLPFTDIPADASYIDAIKYVYDNKMMKGDGNETTFNPNGTLTRAMLVTILHRLEDTPQAQPATFNDVAPDAWYHDAIAWASANHVVAGHSPEHFAPSDAITYEQLNTILMRYAKMKSKTPRSYTDGFDNPKAPATRADVAVILRDFMEK